MTYTQTSLWEYSLGARPTDSHGDHRRMLREAYESLRDRTKNLVESISGDLRQFTVHDITHLDALWGLASEISGPQYDLTPTEGFVLGGAILLHDAGMSLAAYPSGASEIERSPRWQSLIQRNAENPSNPTVIEKQTAMQEFLRLEHSSRAIDLPKLEWRTPTGTSYFLIDNPDIRQKFGQFIGEVAASHWWPHDQVGQRLNRIIPAPPPFPMTWHIDLLKVAGLLRVSDAAHIDERRAPGFTWALRASQMCDESKQHWLFQNRLTQPERRGDALHYNSTSYFDVEAADAWWLAFDAIRVIDRELHKTDVLLADLRGDNHRFAAKRVANVENPTTALNLIPVKGWIPLDTSIKVSNIPRLIRSLGGQALYGDRPLVAVRELIQNAIDAIRSRSAVQPDNRSIFQIKVMLGEEENRKFLEVSDYGTGMSTEIISERLLDFGGTGWELDPIFTEYPGLDPRKIKSIGKFGIGFFSVFLLGDQIELRTRRFDKGFEDTLVLLFARGLNKRPMLRVARPEERLQEGGTVIRVWLNRPLSFDRTGLPHSGERESAFLGFLRKQFPTLEIPLHVTENSNYNILDHSDWAEISGEALLERVSDQDMLPQPFKALSLNMRILRSEAGELLGRMFVGPFFRRRKERPPHGLVTCRGVSAGWITGLYGVFEGEIMHASRFSAFPRLEIIGFRKWLEEQAQLLCQTDISDELKIEAAKVIQVFGANLGALKVAESSQGAMSYEEIEAFVASRDEVIVMDEVYRSSILRQHPTSILESNVILTDSGIPGIFQGQQGSDDDISHWLYGKLFEDGREFADLTLEALVLKAIREKWELDGSLVTEYNRIEDGVDPYTALYSVAKTQDGSVVQERAKLYFKGMSFADLPRIREKAAQDRDVE
jgi:hypothetical protein